jgi:hypothetical protein
MPIKGKMNSIRFRAMLATLEIAAMAVAIGLAAALSLALPVG